MLDGYVQSLTDTTPDVLFNLRTGGGFCHVQRSRSLAKRTFVLLCFVLRMFALVCPVQVQQYVHSYNILKTIRGGEIEEIQTEIRKSLNDHHPKCFELQGVLDFPRNVA